MGWGKRLDRERHERCEIRERTSSCRGLNPGLNLRAARAGLSLPRHGRTVAHALLLFRGRSGYWRQVAGRSQGRGATEVG